jgi:hypothetical protein
MRSMEGPLSGMSDDEIRTEVYHKPCLVFDESECFRVVPSPKGKRFKELLGVRCFESSQWGWLGC